MICEPMLKRDPLTAVVATHGFLYSVVEQQPLSDLSLRRVPIAEDRLYSRSRHVALSHDHRWNIRLAPDQEKD